MKKKSKSWLTRELCAAGDKAQYDGYVKRILGSRQVLARILKGAVREYGSCSIGEIISWIEPDISIANVPLRPGGEEEKDRSITGDSTESKIPGEGTITYDVRFRAFLPGRDDASEIKLLINVEAQKEFYLKYRIVTRGIFYGARMLSEQQDKEFTDSDYDGLKKVYSIWICMNAPAYIGNAMAEYRITKEDLVGNITEQRESYDKLSVVIICLHENGGADCAGTLHGFLNVLLSPVLAAADKEKLLTRDYGMKMEYELGEELRQMCNLSEAIEEKGLERGLEQGILLTKKVMKLSAGGMEEEEIARVCLITAEKVHEILVD